MSDVIDISELDKAMILAALFNASAPQGLGFLQAGSAPHVMSVVDAQAIIDQQGLHFDYVHGRPLKSNLEGDEFNPWGFDRDNGGPGSAQRVIDELRHDGDVNPQGSNERHTELLSRNADQAFEMARTPTTFSEEGDVSTINLGGSDLADPLTMAVLSEMVIRPEIEAMWAEIEADGVPIPPAGMTPREHLDWSSDQALKYYDRGMAEKACVLFLHLVTLNENTAWIRTHPMTGMLLSVGINTRREMEDAMKGFAA